MLINACYVQNLNAQLHLMDYVIEQAAASIKSKLQASKWLCLKATDALLPLLIEAKCPH